MRLSTAVKFLILAHASCYFPSVLCKKGSMGDDTATATSTRADGNDNHNNERMLASLSSKDYFYGRNYIAIIEPNNFLTLFPNGGDINKNFFDFFIDNRSIPQLQGSSTIFNGKVYDPADIAIVNRFNGVELNDITSAIRGFGIGLPFAGNRQPKQPIPPGDSAFFYHGLCVTTSAINGPVPSTIRTRRTQFDEDFVDSLTVSSHSCKLNICLGGGGFACIAFYAGTSFVFDIGQQLITTDGALEPSLPPPFPATIIGGTGSFEGIEGTVDIATICGTTGPILLGVGLTVKIGLIVQTISIKANMPLPVAP